MEHQGSSWATRVCELFNTIETSKDLLKLGQKSKRNKMVLTSKERSAMERKLCLLSNYEEYKRKVRERNKKKYVSKIGKAYRLCRL